MPAENHLIAVLQECPRFTTGQRNPFLAAMRQFQQAAESGLLGRGNGTCADEVGGVEIAATARVMGYQLRN
jgi:hypothetical protein